MFKIKLFSAMALALLCSLQVSKTETLTQISKMSNVERETFFTGLAKTIDSYSEAELIPILQTGLADDNHKIRNAALAVVFWETLLISGDLKAERIPKNDYSKIPDIKTTLIALDKDENSTVVGMALSCLTVLFQKDPGVENVILQQLEKRSKPNDIVDCVKLLKRGKFQSAQTIGKLQELTRSIDKKVADIAHSVLNNVLQNKDSP